MDEDIKMEETIQKTEGTAAGGAAYGVPAGAGTGMPVTADAAGGAAYGVPAGAGTGMPVTADAAGDAAYGAPAGAEAPVTAEAAVNGTAPDAPKGKSGKGRIWGYLAILAAVGLAVLGGWMFYNTRGTRLLYVDVTFGRICNK